MRLTSRERLLWNTCNGPPVILYHRNRDEATVKIAFADDAGTTLMDPAAVLDIEEMVAAAVRVFGLKLAAQTRAGLLGDD